MNNLIDLKEYELAKRITKDFPFLISKMKKINTELIPYKDYIDVSLVINEVTNSIYMMSLTLEAYNEILKQLKGNNDVKKTSKP